nr:hypothetical protein [uncultured bacterium]
MRAVRRVGPTLLQMPQASLLRRKPKPYGDIFQHDGFYSAGGSPKSEHRADGSDGGTRVTTDARQLSSQVRGTC